MAHIHPPNEEGKQLNTKAERNAKTSNMLILSVNQGIPMVEKGK